MIFSLLGETKKIHWLKQQLQTIIDLGPVTWYLGVEFKRFEDGIFLTYKDYALDMLTKFGMSDSKLEHIPMPPGLPLLFDMNSKPIDIYEYCKIVGKLIFLTTTRRDIAYAVSSISHYMSSPQRAHPNAANHILRYIKKTADYGIFHNRHDNTSIQGYTDADWAACPETRRSTGGYLFTMSVHGKARDNSLSPDPAQSRNT